jgi:hypothetical protein
VEVHVEVKRSDINPMPQYFNRYIELLTDVELPQAFDDSIRQLDSLDMAAFAELRDRKYAVDKWTVKEIFQHLIDWERILSARALLFARKEVTVPQSIDETKLAAYMNAERRALSTLVEELRIGRASTKALFESFDDEMLLNRGTNWKYEMSVLALGFTIIGHQVHHLKIITEKYLPLLATSESPFVAK